MPYKDYEIILDIPAKKPSLGFKEYAEAFKDIIQGSEPRFSIGIFGGWGSGKSTLMDEIRDRLDKRKCISVNFSAWRYEKEDHLIVPLLDAIRNSITEWSKDCDEEIEELSKKVANSIGGVTESLLRGFTIKVGVPKMFEASFDANKAISAAAELDNEAAKATAPRSFYFASFEALKLCFTEFHEKSEGARIVIFIDDLDRCLPEGALEVLESMKLFFDFEGFVFIVGLDQQVVEWCIDQRYGSESADSQADKFRISGEDYIKKIFQVPFVLPSVAQRRAEELIETISTNASLPGAQKSDLRENVLPHLQYLLSASNINIRDIKRFLNSYTLVMKVHGQLRPEIVLALQTLAFHPEWRHIFEALRVHGSDLVRELDNMARNRDHAVGEIAPELKSIPLSFEQYLQSNAPGHSLLGTYDLTEYINLATSASATDIGSGYKSGEFLDMLRSVAASRAKLKKDDPPRDRERMVERLRSAEEHILSVQRVSEGLISKAPDFRHLYEMAVDLSREFHILMEDIAPPNVNIQQSIAKQTEGPFSFTEILTELDSKLTDLTEAIQNVRRRQVFH